MRPWLKYGAIVFLLLIGIALGTSWLLTTPSGARWLLGAISRWTSVKIHAEKITGRLADELRLEKVSVHWPEGKMEMDHIHLRWSPVRLLAGKITFSDLDVGGVQIRDDRPESDTPTGLTLPKIGGLPAGLHLEIKSLRLKELIYRRLNQPPFHVEDLSAGLSFHGRTIVVKQLVFDTSIGRGDGSGELNFSEPALALDLRYVPKETILGLDHLSIGLRMLPGRGEEQVAGTIAVIGRSASGERVHLKGELGLTSIQIRLRRFLLSQSSRSGEVAFDGEVNFSTKQPTTRLSLKLKEIDLSKELLFRTKVSGHLLIEGKPSDYRGHFNLENSDEVWRAGRFSGTFRGDLDRVNVSSLDGALLDGTLKGQFEASWAKGISLVGRLQGRDLNPSKITPDWPGKINLNLEGHFYGPEATPSEGKLEVSLLESHLRGKALTGQIDAQIDGGTLWLKRADLHGKDFDLSARGVLDQRLEFEARVSDLSGLIPGIQGSFNGKGWGRWRENQLAGALTGHGKDILIDRIRMASVDMAAQLGEKERAAIDLKAKVVNLVFDSSRVDSISLNLSGKTNQHNIEIGVQWPEGDVQGLLAGSYAKESWEGTITRLSGSYPRGRKWNMSSPAPLQFSAGTFRITSLLLSSQDSERLQVSADLVLKPIRGLLEAEWEDVDLARVNPWVQRPHLSGRSTGRLRNQWLGEGRIKLNAAIDMAGAVEDASLKAERIRGRVRLDWDDRGLEASYEAELSETGKLNGHLSSPQPGRFALPEQGRINVFWKAVDLHLLKRWFPKDLILEGQASGRLSGQWSKGEQWNTEGEMNVAQGAMRWQTKEGLIRSSLQRADFNWSWGDDALEGKFSVALSEYGEMKGKLRLPLAARLPLSISKTGPIELSLHGFIEERELLPILFPKVIQGSWGSADFDLHARGTWQKPLFEGGLQLKKAGIRLLTGLSPSPGKGGSSQTPTDQRAVVPLKLEMPHAGLKMEWGDKGLLASYEMELASGGKLEGQLSSSQPARLALPEKGKLRTTLDGIRLDFVRPWLPSALSLSGFLSGEVEGEWFEEKRLRMKGGLKILQGSWAWKNENGQLSAKIKTADVHLDWHGEELKGDLSVGLERYGNVRGDFNLPLPARLPFGFQAQGPFKVVLQGEMEEKGLLATLFPDLIQESNGKLDLDLTAGGTWEKPHSEGHLKVAGAGAYLPAAGIHLKDVELEARFVNDQVQIRSFRLQSGPGHIEGSATAWIKDWKISRLQGTLGGDRFQTIYFPELQVLCTPRLDYDGTLERLKVRGEIRLPEFSILSLETKGAIRPSSDVVIVDRKEFSKTAPVFPLDAEVRILLGDKVYVKAEGIDARLVGNFTFRAEPSKPLVANGEIQVAQGNYSIYGQRLDITRGRLLFSGPIDNPSLDILALRKVKGATRWEEQMTEVQAGVVVTGNIQSPLIRLYSQPSMPEKDILSYIVLGQPVSKSGDKDQAATLVNAAKALFSAGESALSQNQLSSQLGIDTLDIRATTSGSTGTTTGGAVSHSLVTVGKYLDPRVYIGIGGSPFTKAYQILFRYGLTKKLEVETKAGTESGVNLYYKIEFE